MTRWVYDQAGNITSQVRVTDAGSETDVRTYNNLNQLTASSGGWTYQYDPDGNLIEKNNGDTEDCENWEFTWNENSRLVQVKKGVYDATPTLVNEFTVDYQYDEMGRMLRRDDGTDVTGYSWDKWNLFKETTGETVTEFLVPGLGIRSFLRDGELYTLHQDGLGSVRTVTGSDGLILARLELSAWGEALPGSMDLVPGGLPMDFIGYLGVRRDSLTGLVWMRNRWYSPTDQRFLSRDPIGLAGCENLYLYTRNGPTNLVDTDGLLELYPDPTSSGQEWENGGNWLSAKWSDRTECPTSYRGKEGIDFLLIGVAKGQGEAAMTLPLPISGPLEVGGGAALRAVESRAFRNLPLQFKLAISWATKPRGARGYIWKAAAPRTTKVTLQEVEAALRLAGYRTDSVTFMWVKDTSWLRFLGLKLSGVYQVRAQTGRTIGLTSHSLENLLRGMMAGAHELTHAAGGGERAARLEEQVVAKSYELLVKAGLLNPK